MNLLFNFFYSKKEKDVKELSQLKTYIEKYIMLFELYNYKINKILSKVWHYN